MRADVGAVGGDTLVQFYPARNYQPEPAEMWIARETLWSAAARFMSADSVMALPFTLGVSGEHPGKS